jgi:hypothetical protein
VGDPKTRKKIERCRKRKTDRKQIKNIVNCGYAKKKERKGRKEQ